MRSNDKGWSNNAFSACDYTILVPLYTTQGVVTPVDTVVRATTAVTFWSQGHGGF